jgi:S-adenosylmethionine decarboxylase
MLGTTDAALIKPSFHEAVGTHLLLTLKGCAPEILNDAEVLKQLTEAAARATGATVLQLCSQQFSPQGVTTIAILAESHASLHTYPETTTVFWDCFTCGSKCNPERSIAVLTGVLRPEVVSRHLVERR